MLSYKTIIYMEEESATTTTANEFNIGQGGSSKKMGNDKQNFAVKNSSNVVLGNVTYFTGPIYITRTDEGHVDTINANIDAFEEQKLPIAEIGNTADLRIYPREYWGAEPSTEDYIQTNEPVPFVVISHTATESSSTRKGNKSMLRIVQYFHIYSRDFKDIGYNFLIGNCGNVYEGRGWGSAGRHAKGYNERSVGISFIGCFMNEIPPQKSLDNCKLLIKKGVELGYISPSYKVIGHCQCSATESPGKMLFEEIKTWPSFLLNG